MKKKHFGTWLLLMALFYTAIALGEDTLNATQWNTHSIVYLIVLSPFFASFITAMYNLEEI